MQPGNAQWDAATPVSRTLTVTRATPILTWLDPDSVTYGTPLGPDELDAASDWDGAFVYSPPAGALLGAGTHTLQVQFVPDDPANIEPAEATASLAVQAAEQLAGQGLGGAGRYGAEQVAGHQAVQAQRLRQRPGRAETLQQHPHGHVDRDDRHGGERRVDPRIFVRQREHDQSRSCRLSQST